MDSDTHTCTSWADYGYFDDERNEFVITTPLTPRPWQNRMWNDDLVMEITNHGSGIVYERDHEGRFILYNWSGNRALYIFDRGTGKLWSPAWYPVNAELDEYEVRHGLNYTVISGVKDGVSVTWHNTVHPADACEIWKLEVSLDGDSPRDVLVAPFYEMDLSFKDPYFGSANLYRAHVAPDARCLYVKNYSYRRDLERYALACHSDRPILKYELAREQFLKRFSSMASPRTVTHDEFLNSLPDRQSPVFAPGYDVTLSPGTPWTLQLQFFSADTMEDAVAQSQRYGSSDVCADALDSHRQASVGWTAVQTVQSGDAGIDRYINVWIKQQLRYNATWNRGWNMGFRDSMQDCDAYRMLDPDLVRTRLLAASRHIYADGHTVRKWAAIDDKLYFDGGVWFVNTLVDYVHETGDVRLLEERVPYLDDGKGTVLDHAHRAMAFLAEQRGPGGICRMGFGDWNDALNGIDREGKGESVWTTMAFIWSMRSLLSLLNALGQVDEAGYAGLIAELTGILNERYFEDDRYIRAVTDDGTRIGSLTCAEGQLYLNPQSWAVISGVACGDRARTVMASVREHLETAYGPLLLAPSYTGYDERVGRITSDPPGSVENGANYVHAAMFYAYALVKAGEPDRALDVIRRVLPMNPDNPSATSMLEPFTMTNSFEGPESRHPGRAMFAWRTGGAGWLLKTVWDGMVGVRPELGGLVVDPALPREWSGLRVRRSVRGRNLDVAFHDSPEDAGPACITKRPCVLDYEAVEALDRIDVLRR